MNNAAIQQGNTGHDLRKAISEAIAGNTLNLPPLPEVAAQVVKLSADDTNSISALAAIVERDMALATRVMRVANSALYARRTPVVSLKQAIAWLGMAEIRSIAFAFSVKGEMFVARGREREVALLWSESVATACWAQEIARLKRNNVESAYLCGLLHRLGRAVLLREAAQIERRGQFKLDNEQFETLINEYETRAGASIGTAWKLPAAVISTIEHWRDPTHAQVARVDVLQVNIARNLAAHFGAPDFEIREPQLNNDIVADLGIYPDELSNLLEKREAIAETVANFE
ncbi:MAG: HDOD domain-containing protein [Steroidobacteraceae bacterium]